MSLATPKFEYRSDENILFVNNFAGRTFSTERSIDQVFAEVEHYWKAHCNVKLYIVVDYTNVTIDPKVSAYFGKRRAGAVENFSHTTVRYGADLSARAALRAMAVKTHVPSNLYETKDEAIAIVRGIQNGSILVKSA